jgi:type IV pilus assembly protein PilC
MAKIFREVGTFPDYVCAMLSVAEQVGKQEETLDALAKYYEKRAELGRQIRSILLYPLLLLGVIAVVMIVLLIWVLPVFREVYAGMGSTMRGLAGVLLQIGDGLRTALPYLCGILILVALIACVPAVRRGVKRFFIKHAGDRSAWKLFHTASFLQALAMGYISGMSAQEALALSAELAEGETEGFRARCSRVTEAVSGGMDLADALKEASFLTPQDARLLKTGMKSGRGEAILEELADRSAARSEEAMEALIGRIEPAMIVIACVLIGMVLLSVMLPLINMMTAIG